ncbi:MAG: rRNA small subunit methyltransferase [Chthonomonadaceae bacterium]|nr:rRNA small subunit methyltransferase [Chthonomonadaceae bacterium]
MIPARSAARVGTGTLFVVSMPIGDPEDITLRALRILRGVSLIVAENARVSRAFLAPHSVSAEIVSLRARLGTPALAAALAHLDAGDDVALIADSGTPTVVDPGLRLIQLAIERDHRVTSLPGATACLAALALSGFSPTPFSFLGVPPRRLPQRTTFFSHLAGLDQTVVLYESPRYLHTTLTELSRCLGPTRKIVVACDLTHTNERIFRGTISAVLTEFAENTPSGACTLVVSGPPTPDNT